MKVLDLCIGWFVKGLRYWLALLMVRSNVFRQFVLVCDFFRYVVAVFGKL
jgi:hypothetical protein